MASFMSIITHAAKRSRPEIETEYDKEKRVHWPGRVALERTREELDRQIHLRGGLW